MIFFKGTVKGLKSDEDQETLLTLRIPGSEYDRVAEIGKRTKQILVFGVFTEDEFTEWSDAELAKES